MAPIKGLKSLDLSFPSRDSATQIALISKDVSKIMKKKKVSEAQALATLVQEMYRIGDPDLLDSYQAAAQQIVNMHHLKSEELKEVVLEDEENFETDLEEGISASKPTVVAKFRSLLSPSGTSDLKNTKSSIKMAQFPQDSKNLASFALEIAQAIEYKSLDLDLVRSSVLESFSNKDVIKAMVVMSSAGNNYLQRLKSSSNKEMAMEISTDLKNLNVKVRKGGSTNSDLLTLSRICIAFCPLYLTVRKLLESQGKLRVIIPDSCPILWQDFALAGHPQIPDSYSTFHEKFSLILALAESKDAKPEEVKSKSSSFQLVAKSGYQSDQCFSQWPQNESMENQLNYVRTYYKTSKN